MGGGYGGTYVPPPLMVVFLGLEACLVIFARYQEALDSTSRVFTPSRRFLPESMPIVANRTKHPE